MTSTKQSNPKFLKSSIHFVFQYPNVAAVLYILNPISLLAASLRLRRLCKFRVPDYSFEA